MSDTQARIPNPPKIRSVRAWVDSGSRPLESGADEGRVDWVRAVPFLAMHAACIGVLFVGVSAVALWTALALYVVRMFAITAFYHRYFAHRTFRASRAVQFGFALPALSLVYDAQRTLREFRGIGPVRDRHGRNLGVVIRFPADPLLQPASRDEVEAAERAPLDGTCRL